VPPLGRERDTERGRAAPWCGGLCDQCACWPKPSDEMMTDGLWGNSYYKEVYEGTPSSPTYRMYDAREERSYEVVCKFGCCHPMPRCVHEETMVSSAPNLALRKDVRLGRWLTESRIYCTCTVTCFFFDERRARLSLVASHGGTRRNRPIEGYCK
jgi:hypothetical protein